MTNEQTREFGAGTALTQRFPWGLYIGGRALCSDGRVRRLARIAITADSFFSIPASVRVSGRTVSGFVSFGEIPGGVEVVKFTATGKNAGLLP